MTGCFGMVRAESEDYLRRLKRRNKVQVYKITAVRRRTVANVFTSKYAVQSNMSGSFFYPNSGGEQYISLYLSCEPTPDEKARGPPQSLPAQSSQNPNLNQTSASSSKQQNSVSETQIGSTGWFRDGNFKFVIELRSPDRHLYKIMEANEPHSFDCFTRNWGWSQFQTRNTAYYNNAKARADDALLIVCSITYPQTNPTTVGPVTPRRFPPELVQAYASLFDSKDHSDVVFIVKVSRNSTDQRHRKLYAIRQILSMRSEYFADMFNGGWSESCLEGEDERSIDSDDQNFEDLEEEEDEDDWSNSIHDNKKEGSDDEGDQDLSQDSQRNHENSFASSSGLPPSASGDEEDDPPASTPLQSPIKRQHSVGKRPKSNRAVVHIEDSCYRTFKSLLYYLYTDDITFAPLASSYQVAKATALAKGQPWPFQTLLAWARVTGAGQSRQTPQRNVDLLSRNVAIGFANAKNIYTLADKLRLPDLKARALSHIARSLTVNTVALDVFSPFSTQFEEIQLLQRSFLLAHWKEVRRSTSMKQVFQNVGDKRYPGFAQVFTAILQHLEYCPRPDEMDITQNSRDGVVGW